MSVTNEVKSLNIFISNDSIIAVKSTVSTRKLSAVASSKCILYRGRRFSGLYIAESVTDVLGVRF